MFEPAFGDVRKVQFCDITRKTVNHLCRHNILLVMQPDSSICDFARIQELKRSLYGMCRVHKPGVPHGHASQQKARPGRRRCERRATSGPAQNPNDRPEGRSNLRPEGLAKRNSVRFRLRPTSSTRRPGREGTSLAFDSGPSLQPKGLAEKERRSLPTPAHLSDQKA